MIDMEIFIRNANTLEWNMSIRPWYQLKMGKLNQVLSNKDFKYLDSHIFALFLYQDPSCF